METLPTSGLKKKDLYELVASAISQFGVDIYLAHVSKVTRKQLDDIVLELFWAHNIEFDEFTEEFAPMEWKKDPEPEPEPEPEPTPEESDPLIHKPFTRWTLPQLKHAAEPYPTRSQFARGNKAAYFAARGMGVLDLILPIGGRKKP